MTTVRKCSTCKHYEPAPIWRKGWCRNPHLYSPQQSHLVGEEDLDCDRGMGNYWEPLDPSGVEGTQPRSPEPIEEENVDAPRPAMKNAPADVAQPIMMHASRPSNSSDSQRAGGGGSKRPGGAGRPGSESGDDAGASGGWRGGDTSPFRERGGGGTGPFSGSDDPGRGGGLGRFARGGKSGGGGALSRFTGGGKLGGGGFSRFTGGGGSGGRGGGNDDDDDGNAFTPPPREPRRPAGTPERQFTYYTEQRYWTDYLRIAAPVLGVILILGLLWFWLGSFLGGGEPTPSPTPSPSIAGAASSSLQSQSPLIIAETATPTAPASSPRVVATPDASEAADADTFVFAKGDNAVVGNTDGDGANLRSEPDANAEIVTVLDDGTKLDITGDSLQKGPLTWWPVTTPEGDEGYIVEDLLKPFDPTE